MVSNKRNKPSQNSPIKLTVNWQHTEEVSPALKLLMRRLLLKPKDNHPVETVRTDEERHNE